MRAVLQPRYTFIDIQSRSKAGRRWPYDAGLAYVDRITLSVRRAASAVLTHRRDRLHTHALAGVHTPAHT